MDGDIKGMTAAEVNQSRRLHGRNVLDLHRVSAGEILWRQVNNPLLFILAATTVLAYALGERTNALIISVILLVSIGLGFWQEYGSEKIVRDLLRHISLLTVVARDKQRQDIPAADVVVGDVVFLHQGSVVPADLTLWEAENFSADESALTGESAPVPKEVGDIARMGTVVYSGVGMGVVRAVGKHTAFGRLAKRVSLERQLTAFQLGLRRFGTGLSIGVALFAAAITALNIALGRSPLESALFALAVAIGLTPALLPVILTVGMSQGARRLGRRGVIVKQLPAIEDFGNLDVLCTDKTGTLTDGTLKVQECWNTRGEQDAYVLECAMTCNSAEVHHRIIGNPIDVAIWEYARAHHAHLQRTLRRLVLTEFDFEQRGQFVIADRVSEWPRYLDVDSHPIPPTVPVTKTVRERILIFKGAPDQVLERCRTYRNREGVLTDLGPDREGFRRHFHALNDQGLRLIAVAQRPVETQEKYTYSDAADMEFIGFLTFLDTPKPSAKAALTHLEQLGITVKVLTGDNERVTRHVCAALGLSGKIISGPGFSRLTRLEQRQAVKEAVIFARFSPEQKAQVIELLRQAGRTVGYLGDGINDAPALHAADVGISVNTGADIAKDLAGIVLLRKGLDVIAEGVREGRRIFANTITYILMGTSSNAGNMVSVAGASFLLPFLPMAPVQVLVNNSLYDAAQLAIPGDRVDPEVLERPHHWNLRLIYRYMLFFGPLSTLFDFLGFAVFWYGWRAVGWEFQTGWFLLSLTTQVLVVFSIRTWRWPSYRSRPSGGLLVSSLTVLVAAYLLPYTAVAPLFHLTPLTVGQLGAIGALTAGYLIVVESLKTALLRPLLTSAGLRRPGIPARPGNVPKLGAAESPLKSS
jgi:Mg2+-importing ATPase